MATEMFSELENLQQSVRLILESQIIHNTPALKTKGQG
jgi:hypothetical protein